MTTQSILAMIVRRMTDNDIHRHSTDVGMYVSNARWLSYANEVRHNRLFFLRREPLRCEVTVRRAAVICKVARRASYLHRLLICFDGYAAIARHELVAKYAHAQQWLEIREAMI